MRRTTLSVLSSLAILLSGMIVPEAAAQSRRDKEQTYVLEKPYEVKKLVPPTGKKIKNVILMIGDGMSLMHMYSAWTAGASSGWTTPNTPASRKPIAPTASSPTPEPEVPHWPPAIKRTTIW